MRTAKNLFISAFTLLLFSCNEDQKQSQEVQIESDLKSLDHSEFYIEHPSTWTSDQSGKMGSTLVVLAPLDHAEDDFRENVNLMIQNLEGTNMDMAKFIEVSEDQINSQAMPNSKLISSDRISASDGEFHKMIYTADQSIYHLQFEAYCWIKNEKAYVLTFSAEQAEFKDYQPTAEKILNSFKLK
jgi:hypothetical protein